MESTLRHRVREAIRAGKLPNRRPERTWGGRGDGAPCAICDELVQQDEVEFELDFGRSEDDPGLGNDGMGLLVHLRCFQAWELERQNFDASVGPIPASEPTRLAASAGASESNSGTASSGVLPGQAGDGTIPDCDRETS